MIIQMVAPTDGFARAKVEATVSGKTEITNSMFVDEGPRLEEPRPYDPITTWVEVYVNGEPLQENGKNKKHLLLFDDELKEDHEAGWEEDKIWWTARFSYDKITVSDVISVEVDEGDYVEFYFYNRIEADAARQCPLQIRAISGPDPAGVSVFELFRDTPNPKCPGPIGPVIPASKIITVGKESSYTIPYIVLGKTGEATAIAYIDHASITTSQ